MERVAVTLETLARKLPHTQDVLDIARRVVWFKRPEETLKDPVHFMAHLMTYTTVEDILAMRKYLSLDDFRFALDHAPAGVFDPRSWSYWNIICGRYPVPEMPRRRIGESDP